MNSIWCVFTKAAFLLALQLGVYAFDAQASSSSQKVAESLRITHITPSGNDVPLGRQVVFHFDKAVVAIGRMERQADEIPISFKPSLNCEWRWLDTRRLSCQLDKEHQLKPATRYKVRIKKGIIAQDGTKLSEELWHEFLTIRPIVRNAYLKEWEGADMPIFNARFNHKVTKASVEKAIRIKIKDRTEFIKVRAIVPKHVNRDSEQGSKKIRKSDIARYHWEFKPNKALPFDQNFSLQVQPGLHTPGGQMPGVEKRSLIEFASFGDFKFSQFICGHGKNIVFADYKPAFNQQALVVKGKCPPLSHVNLEFTAPVTSMAIKKHLLVDSQSDREYEKSMLSSYGFFPGARSKNTTYMVTLPYRFMANKTYTLKSGDQPLLDMFGRKLLGNLDIVFSTDHYQPFFTLDRTTVFESQVQSDLMVETRNHTGLNIDYKFINAQGRYFERQNKDYPIPLKPNEWQSIPLNIRQILKGKPGVVIGNVDAQPNGDRKSHRLDDFFVQVTPYNLHLKKGYFNSLLWVSDLKSGELVTDAQVAIYENYIEGRQPYQITHTKTSADGIAILPGTLDIKKKLDKAAIDYSHGIDLHIVVIKNDAIAVLPVTMDFKIADNARHYDYPREEYAYIRTWGTSAQAVYKAGDTVQFKIFVKNQSNEQLIPAIRKGYSIEVTDPMEKVVFSDAEIHLSEFGTYHNEFKLSKQAVSGRYTFILTNKKFNNSKHYDYDNEYYPLEILVSDFVPAAFQVNSELDKKVYDAGNEVKISSQAMLYSGGPYGNSGLRVIGHIKEMVFHSDHPLAKDFYFGAEYDADDGYIDLYENESQLNSQGKQIESFVLEDPGFPYGHIEIESAVSDERGKDIANTATAEFIGRDRFVGLQSTQWVYQKGDKAQIKYIVVDQQGEPLDGVPVKINIQHKTHRWIKKNGKDRHIVEWQEAAGCEGIASKDGSRCEFVPKSTGMHKVRASIRDTRQRESFAEIYPWVTGSRSRHWYSSDSKHLRLIPERTSYQVGETINVIFENPFANAKALITVERYGVLRSWVQSVETGMPMIKVPVEKSDIPGFYLSVLLFSHRTGQELNEQGKDMGKPDYRLGSAEILVEDRTNRLNVSIASKRKQYKPREKVALDIEVKPYDGNKQEAIELAVVAIDEAVFDLNPEKDTYYDIYRGLNWLSANGVGNYSLLKQLRALDASIKKKNNDSLVSARRAYKSVASDAEVEEVVVTGTKLYSEPKFSTQDMRNIIDYIGYWNPSIVFKHSGRKTIKFEAPDNLTRWKILALATTARERMGLGESAFQVNKAIELRPVMPNQLIEGDRFLAGFNVLNRQEQPRNINVMINLSGDEQFAKQATLSLKPFQRETIWLPVETKRAGVLNFTAQAVDQDNVEFNDGIKHQVQVNKYRSLLTAANYGTSTDNQIKEVIEIPQNIYADKGAITVTTSPTVIGNIEGAFTYMRDYPYLCWEQRLSKAVMASHYQNLKQYFADEILWPDSNELVHDMLKSSADFQAENGGMTFWEAKNEYVSPYLSAYTALAFNWLEQSGYQIPAAVRQKLHRHLLELLDDEHVPGYFDKSMTSTVRAVAIAALAPHDVLEYEYLDAYEQYLPYMSLFGKAYLLKAIHNMNNSEQLKQLILEQILSSVNYSAGKVQFNEMVDVRDDYLLATPMRTNCAILSALLDASQDESTQAKIEDIAFKQVRAITQTRGGKSYWNNTQENIFCLNALLEYSRIYEKQKPEMTVQAYMDREKIGQVKYNDYTDKPKTFKSSIAVNSIGKRKEISIDKQGVGRLYYSTRLQYAPLEESSSRINAGFDLRREYSVERKGQWHKLESPMRVKRGEVIKVDLFISTPTARHFVVVDDSVPGGLEPINQALATSSKIDADKAEGQYANNSWWSRYDDWVGYGVWGYSFYHQELRHDSVRYYSDYLPPGNYHLGYTAQVIAEGEFSIMPAHSEEMYDPEVFGKSLPGKLIVTDDRPEAITMRKR